MSESDRSTSSDSDGADLDVDGGEDDVGFWTPQRRQAQRREMANNNRASGRSTDWFDEEQATGPHVRLTKKDDPTFSVTVNT